ncbi:MAG: hypothetical protein ACLFPA_01035 [Dichotomicrobium sp.]
MARSDGAFLHDTCHEKRVLKDGAVPADFVKGKQHCRPEMQGADIPRARNPSQRSIVEGRLI